MRVSSKKLHQNVFILQGLFTSAQKPAYYACSRRACEHDELFWSLACHQDLSRIDLDGLMSVDRLSSQRAGKIVVDAAKKAAEVEAGKENRNLDAE